MAIQPGQPQSIGGVLDTTFQLYKASVARVVPICLLLFVASLPSSLYMMIARGADPTRLSGVMAAMYDPIYWLMYAISLLLTLWGVGALYLKVHAIGTGEALSLVEALKRGLGRVVPFLLMAILFAIALAVGTVLLVVPALILMISLLLGANLLLFENKGPVEALSGSHRLVWGNWWRTAAILTVGFIIVMVLYSLVGLLFAALLPLVGIGGIEDILVAGFVIGLLVGLFLNLLLMPFYVALLIAVYWDLKLRKEGADLAARVGALDPA